MSRGVASPARAPSGAPDMCGGRVVKPHSPRGNICLMTGKRAHFNRGKSEKSTSPSAQQVRPNDNVRECTPLPLSLSLSLYGDKGRRRPPPLRATAHPLFMGCLVSSYGLPIGGSAIHVK